MRKYFWGLWHKVTWILRRKLVALLAIAGALSLACLFLSRLNSNSRLDRSGTDGEPVQFLNVSAYAFLRNNPETCALPLLTSTESSKQKQLLAVLVISARDHFEYRRSIRETWGSVQENGDWVIRRIFIIGNRARGADLYNEVFEDSIDVRLDDEISTHGDIAVADFSDTYLNLSTKHVISYRWVLDHCPQATYVVKTDDDMFINVFGLLDFMDETLTASDSASAASSPAPAPRDLLCHAWQSAPERGPADQWHVSYDVYAEESYPLYCIDAAYVTTPEMIRGIYSVHDQVKYLWISDCFVTGLLRARYNEQPEAVDRKIGIHDIQDLYQLNDKKLDWNPRTLFYLLKKKDGMRFQRMEAYWSLALVHQASKSDHGAD